MIEPFGFGPPQVLPRPPAADLDVVLLVQPVRRVVGRNVGQIEQPGAHPLTQLVRFRRSRPLLLPQGTAARPEIVRLDLVTGLAGRADLAGQFLHLGALRFGASQLGPVLDVGGDHGVDLGRLDPAARQRGLDGGGIVAQQADIDHSASK